MKGKRVIAILICVTLLTGYLPTVLLAEKPVTAVHDNEFLVRFDDLVPENGTRPEVTYRIDQGEPTPCPRDEATTFFTNEGTISEVTFSLKPATQSNGDSVGFYRVRIDYGQPDGPAELDTENGVLYDGETGAYSFSATPFAKDEGGYEGFMVDIFWTEEEYNGGDSHDPQYTLTLDYDSDKGRIMINNQHESGQVFVNTEDHVTVRIECYWGYQVADVVVDEKSVGAVTSYVLGNVTANHTIAVTFKANEYTITASAGAGGSISPSGDIRVEHGSKQSFTITPDTGYRIRDVWVDGNPQGMDSVYELDSIDRDYTLYAEFEPRGDGSTHCITVTQPMNGTIAAEGLSDGQIIISDGYDQSFIITPDPGYAISEVVLYDSFGGFNDLRNMEYSGDGSFAYTIQDVRADVTLEVRFVAVRLGDLLDKSYAVLPGGPEEIKSTLIEEFAYLGYVVHAEQIVVSDISPITDEGYGTFGFTVTMDDDTSSPQTGYIVNDFSNIIFKYEGTSNETPFTEIRVAKALDGENRVFGAPAMDSGFLEIFGPYSVRIEGVTSPDVANAFTNINQTTLQVHHAFYRIQLHITNRFSWFGPDSNRSLNWYAFDLIQDNAYCVKVTAGGGNGAEEQQTLQWRLNRYAQLSTGSYTSEVFFGNDVFTLSLPEAAIGGVTSFSIDEGDFPGYTVSKNDDGTYSVHFLSDFYDRIPLDLAINGKDGLVSRQLTIHRVGVHIEAYNGPNPPAILHGTGGLGTLINYDTLSNYRVYASYHIPDDGVVAPYGLYVTYHWADGSITTRIIREPEKGGNLETPEDFNGVFTYERDADVCDYLLYSAPNGYDAPARIFVTVLKDDPLVGGSFGGIHLGSGAGVEWINR